MSKGGAAAIALLVLGAALPLGADTRPSDRFDTVVIDAGHGGENEGARGPDGVLEKQVVLDVSRRLAEHLRREGLRVVLTREDDRFVPLEQRTAIANDAGGDLFVSIHCNAHTSRDVKGVETYFLSLEASDEAAGRVAQRENMAFASSPRAAAALGDPLLDILSDLIATDHLRESDEFARFAYAELVGATGSDRRGVRQAPFVVLMGLRMPASLIEIGFLTHPKEGRALLGAARKEEIAAALARAVLRFQRRFDARRGAPAAGEDGDQG